MLTVVLELTLTTLCVQETTISTCVTTTLRIGAELAIYVQSNHATSRKSIGYVVTEQYTLIRTIIDFRGIASGLYI